MQTVKATVKIKVKVATIIKQAAAYLKEGMSLAGAMEKAALTTG